MYSMNIRFIKKYRIKILAFAVLFVMVGILLLSEIYMIKESNHECQHEGCPICMNMMRCKDIIMRTGTGGGESCLLLCLFVFAVMIATIKFQIVERSPFTLTRQRIRLDE